MCLYNPIFPRQTFVNIEVKQNTFPFYEKNALKTTGLTTPGKDNPLKGLNLFSKILAELTVFKLKFLMIAHIKHFFKKRVTVRYTLNRIWSDTSWFEHFLITEDIPIVKVGNGTQTFQICFLAWLQVFLYTQEQVTLSVLCRGLVAKENILRSAFVLSEAIQVGELTRHSCPHPKAKTELNICWGNKSW